MRILVVTLSNIGDAVLTTAVLDALKYKFPQAVIDILAGERAKDVFTRRQNTFQAQPSLEDSRERSSSKTIQRVSATAQI